MLNKRVQLVELDLTKLWVSLRVIKSDDSRHWDDTVVQVAFRRTRTPYSR